MLHGNGCTEKGSCDNQAPRTMRKVGLNVANPTWKSQDVAIKPDASATEHRYFPGRSFTASQDAKHVIVLPPFAVRIGFVLVGFKLAPFTQHGDWLNGEIPKADHND